MVNQRDVAKKVGISSATVSRYINNVGLISHELREKIAKAIIELDYQPNLVARSLKMKSSKTIGLIFPHIDNRFFIRLIKKAEEISFKEGYSVILCNTDNDIEKEKLYIDVIKGKLIDGFIVITSFKDKSYLESALKNEKVVYLDRDPGLPGQALIKLDNIKGAEMAVDYLTSLGHRRIGLLNVTTDITPGAERYEGYLKALKRKNIKPDKNLVKISDFTVKDSIVKANELLTMKERPSAILSISNLETIGTLKAIMKMSLKIPDDISIIGFDDLRTAELLSPPLTVIAQPEYEFGEVGIRTLLNKIKGKEIGGKVINLEPELIIRGSCRKI